ncbi:MAG TPA: ROK family protein, partial [Candidatus Limnocylindrales bacterium]|nr:ROK family protein [Candidatus Limnocylindrales bacterium]
MPDGSRIARVSVETPTEDGPEAIVAACIAVARSVRERVPADLAPDGLEAIGISSPGPLDPWAGVVVEPPNLGPRFVDVPLAAELEAALGLPAYLERDTNVAALAEQAYGAGRGIDDFIYLTVSTGVGGAVVTDGRLLLGPDGVAGELGHLVVDFGPDAAPCGCGGFGHVEAYASGRALARDAVAAVR